MVPVTVSTCRTRRCLSRRSSVRPSWIRLLVSPPCCHAAGGHWTWMRLCRSSVQLPRPTSGTCDGAAPVSTYVARHCRGQCVSVCRSLMGAQARRQTAPPDDACTLLVDLLSSLLPEHTDLSVMSSLVDTKQVNVDQSSCRGCGPSCRRRTFASATSPL